MDQELKQEHFISTLAVQEPFCLKYTNKSKL